MNKVDNLKKIKVSFQAGTSHDTMNLSPKYPELDFIFGLGSEGMTPFEYELVEKDEGESVLIHLKKALFYGFFGHINPPLLDLFDGRNDVYLKVKIEAATPADQREIVKAMACLAAHGGAGCDCGCGCGS